MDKATCPKCGSTDIMLNKKKQVYVCEDCSHEFTIEHPFQPLRIFISYGHDDHAGIAVRLKEDMKARGHEVWFDEDRLKPGHDWERYIEDGLDWVGRVPGKGRVILLMTPHSVRRPDGYCLNEIARALQRKLSVVPVMLVWCEPPLSICRIQWLDMRDCIESVDRYPGKFDRLMEAIEQNKLDFEGSQARLLHLLEPLPFDADIIEHITRFVGRQWVFDRIDSWKRDPGASRIFWITGAPGAGKTALAARLCANRRDVIAFHLCRHGHVHKSDPRRCVLSLAYQLSTQLPEYQEILNGLNLEDITKESNARTLFDYLFIQPLSGDFPRPERDIVILIDALDEASSEGENELASFIATEFPKTPEWLKLIITSRPDPEVMHPLQGLSPYILDTTSEENLRDIREYLLKELKPFYDYIERSPDILDIIIERSEGNFLYIDWLCKELVEGRLSIERSSEFPQGLGGIYAQFFKRQFPDVTGYKANIRPALSIMAASQEPLDLCLIMSIMEWDEYQLNEFCMAIGSLFNNLDGKLQPFHKSLMDWLIECKLSGSYFVSVNGGHKLLSAYGWNEYIKGAATMSHYMLANLPIHLARAERWKELEKVLTDLGYIEAKCKARKAFDLIADYEYGGAGLKAGPLVRTAWLNGKDAGIFCPNCCNWSRIGTNDPGTVIECPECVRSLAVNPFFINAGWAPSAHVNQVKKKAGVPHPGVIDVSDFADFVQSQAAILAKDPELVYQQAGNQPDNSAVYTAFRALITNQPDHKPWVRWINKPQHRSPCRLILSGHAGTVNSCAFSLDGRKIVSASSDRTLKIWDGETGKELKTLSGHTDQVNTCAFSPDSRNIASGSEDRTIKLWDARTGEELRSVTGHSAIVRSCIFSPDGALLASTSDDKTIRIWNVETMALLKELAGHKNTVRACAFSPDGKKLVSASRDMTLKIWDVSTGREIKSLAGHLGGVRACAFSPDGKKILSASDDFTLKLWDAETGIELKTMAEHWDSIAACAFSPDGKKMVSVAWEGIRIWDTASCKDIALLTGHAAAIKSFAFSPDGRRVLTASEDMTLKIWDVETRTKTEHGMGHLNDVDACAFSQDAKKIVTASRDRTLKIWDASTGVELATLSGHTYWVTSCTFSPDGTKIVSGSSDKTLKIWDAISGNEIRTLRGHTDWVTACDFSPDGSTIVSGSYDKTIRKWDLMTGDLLATFTGHEQGVTSCAFSPDGTKILSGSKDNKIKLWSVDTGAVLMTLTGHDLWVTSCAFSPDGTKILSGSSDKLLKIWDAISGNEIRTLRGHTDWITSCGFSPDGKTIISGSDDNTIRIWDVESGNELAKFYCSGGAIVLDIASLDGRIVAGDNIGNVYNLQLTDIPSGQQ